MPSRARRRRWQRPASHIRGPRLAPVPRHDAQGSHPLGPNDPTRRAPLRRAGRRAQRVLHPQGLHHHAQHLVRPFLSRILRLVPFVLSLHWRAHTNNRHFLHDPEVYKSPMTFNPDRLISRPGKPAEPDPFDVAFGYGRR